MEMALSEEQIRYLNHHPPGEAVASALSELLANDHDLSRVDRQIDLRKLRGYKQQLGYEHALFVEVGTEGRAIITMLEWA